MSRVGNDHFTFTQGSSVLDPGSGFIRDKDSVLTAADKLALIFPERLPSVVPMGDAILPGTTPSRTVRHVFSSRGRVLTENVPLGKQCLTVDFQKYDFTNSSKFFSLNSQGLPK